MKRNLFPTTDFSMLPTGAGDTYFFGHVINELIVEEIKRNPGEQDIVGSLRNAFISEQPSSPSGVAMFGDMVRRIVQNANKEIARHRQNPVKAIDFANSEQVRFWMHNNYTRMGLNNLDAEWLPGGSRFQFFLRSFDTKGDGFVKVKSTDHFRLSGVEALVYAIDAGTLSEDTMARLYQVVVASAVNTTTAFRYPYTGKDTSDTVYVNGEKCKIEIDLSSLSRYMCYANSTTNHNDRWGGPQAERDFVDEQARALSFHRVHSALFVTLMKACESLTTSAVRVRLKADFITASLRMAGVETQYPGADFVSFTEIVDEDEQQHAGFGRGNDYATPISNEQLYKKIHDFYTPLIAAAEEAAKLDPKPGSPMGISPWGSPYKDPLQISDEDQQTIHIHLKKPAPQQPAAKNPRAKRIKKPLEPVKTTKTT